MDRRIAGSCKLVTPGVGNQGFGAVEVNIRRIGQSAVDLCPTVNYSLADERQP